MYQTQAWRRGKMVTISAPTKEELEGFLENLNRDIAGMGQTHPINHTEILLTNEEVKK